MTAIDQHTIAVAGAGTAVVEMVLAVPEGAAPELSLCKSRAGAVSVKVDRLTDGVVKIANLSDAGADGGPAPGCEDRVAASMTRADYIGPVRWPRRSDPRPLVLAWYFPWYDARALAQDYGDQPTGPADTSDPAVVAQAVDLAARSGIDGFVLEWSGVTAEEPRIDAVYDAADRRGGFMVEVGIDFATLRKVSGDVGPAQMDAALQELAKRVSRPSQLRKDGQPVLFVYGASTIDQGLWGAALDRLRSSTGIVPFVIADAPLVGAQGRYDYVVASRDFNDLLSWAAGALRSLRILPGLQDENGPLWVAPVTPGYDDRKLRRSTQTYVDRTGGTRYDQAWTAALLSLPDWVLVTSWNEYYEQTHVMPGTATGTRALAQTASWSAQFHQTG